MTDEKKAPLWLSIVTWAVLAAGVCALVAVGVWREGKIWGWW